MNASVIIGRLLESSLINLELFAVTLLLGLPLGLIIAFGSMSRFTPLRKLVRGFVWVIRGTPLMLQLIVIFYGPGLLFDLPAMPRFTATIVAFSINYACYFSEIYRGGIESISPDAAVLPAFGLGDLLWLHEPLYPPA